MAEFKGMNDLSLRKLNYMATYRRINVGRQSATGIIQYHHYVCVIVSIQHGPDHAVCTASRISSPHRLEQHSLERISSKGHGK